MNDYAQLLSLMTGGQQTPADVQQGPNWLQWLMNARGGGTSAGGGATSGMSGLGSAMMGNAGGGAVSGLGKGLSTL